MSQQQQQQVGASPFDAFWNGSFNTANDITWEQFQNAINSSFGINYADALNKGNKTMSKANCRIFVSMFGPLNELHQRCKDAVDSGFFHGEQTSQESDECFKKTGRTPGSYLVRLRKGAKHQIALAFVDDSHNTKHMLISITKGGFTLHAGGASYPYLSGLVSLFPTKFVTPIKSNIMEIYGPITARNPSSNANRGVVIEYIKQQVDRVKPDALLYVDVSSMGVQRRMKFELTITADQMLERIARKTPGIDRDKMGAYLKEGGIWLTPATPLSSYLLSDNNTIEIVNRPEPQNIRVVGVNNEFAGCRDEIMVDSSTTIFGIIRSCTKPADRIADISKYGVRITVIAPNVMFFCDPSFMINDYEIGTRYMEIDVAMVTSMESILPPQKVAEFIATSYASLPPSAQPSAHTQENGINDIGDAHYHQQQQQQQEVSQVQQIPVSKLGSPSMTFTPSDPKPPNQEITLQEILHLQQQQQQHQQVVKPQEVPQQQQQQVVKPQEVPQQQQQQQQRRKTLEGIDKTKILEINTDVFVPVNPNVVVSVPDGLPQASASIKDMALWMGEMIMLYGWWASKSPEEKEKPENITYVANVAKNLFPDKDDPERVKKLDLLKSVVPKEQLVSLFMCLSFAHSLKQ